MCVLYKKSNYKNDPLNIYQYNSLRALSLSLITNSLSQKKIPIATNEYNTLPNNKK